GSADSAIKRWRTGENGAAGFAGNTPQRGFIRDKRECLCKRRHDETVRLGATGRLARLGWLGDGDLVGAWRSGDDGRLVLTSGDLPQRGLGCGAVRRGDR